MRSDVVVLRPAEQADADAMADVWLRSFSAALPTVRRVPTDDEVRRWFASVVLVECEPWVAQVGGSLAGLLALRGAEIEQLYLEPSWRGRGLGDRFVALAKRERPHGLELWTFQVNAPARRFYERHGFVAAELTDGSRNEEQEPDVRYVWPGEPLADSRRRSTSSTHGHRIGCYETRTPTTQSIRRSNLPGSADERKV